VRPYYDKMKRKLRTESDSPLETLRLDFTDLTQDQFIVRCKMSRATYQRWISGQTMIKPTPEQITEVCRTCNISLKTFFGRLGIDVTGIPDDCDRGGKGNDR
jgi:transcriptional regulator with XRE-family HTH domain